MHVNYNCLIDYKKVTNHDFDTSSFIDASISIRRTTHEFNYQLVVTRTFQEGEELLLEEDTESEFEISSNCSTDDT